MHFSNCTTNSYLPVFSVVYILSLYFNVIIIKLNYYDLLDSFVSVFSVSIKYLVV